jgi:hypothetical protein
MSAGDSTTIRVPDRAMQRASALVGRLGEEKPGLLAASPGGRLTRAQVYRLAAEWGLREMEGVGVSFDGPVAGVGDEAV